MDFEKQTKLLASSNWHKLEREALRQDGFEYLGIYILAYSDQLSDGDAVKVEDIFYVGMTNSANGIKGRL